MILNIFKIAHHNIECKNKYFVCLIMTKWGDLIPAHNLITEQGN